MKLVCYYTACMPLHTLWLVCIGLSRRLGGCWQKNHWIHIEGKQKRMQQTILRHWQVDGAGQKGKKWKNAGIAECQRIMRFIHQFSKHWTETKSLAVKHSMSPCQPDHNGLTHLYESKDIFISTLRHFHWNIKSMGTFEELPKANTSGNRGHTHYRSLPTELLLKLFA